MLELRLGCAGPGSRARHARTCSAQRATVAAAIAAAGALAQVTAAEGGRGGGVCGRIQSDARLAWDDGCATHRGPAAPAGRLSWCPSLPWARRRRRLVRRVTSDRLRSARAGAAAVSGAKGVAPLPGNGRRVPGGPVASRRRRRLGQHPSARGERHKRSGRAPGPVTLRPSAHGSYLPGRRMPAIMKAGCE